MMTNEVQPEKTCNDETFSFLKHLVPVGVVLLLLLTGHMTFYIIGAILNINTNIPPDTLSLALIVFSATGYFINMVLGELIKKLKL